MEKSSKLKEVIDEMLKYLGEYNDLLEIKKEVDKYESNRQRD